MNPLALAVDLVRDYVYVAARQFEVMTGKSDPEDLIGTRTGRPVLLLPGIYENWRFMLPLAQRLADQGHPVHVVPDLGHNRDTITGSALIVDALIQVRDLQGAVIVAHSKGGLIGKQVMIDAEPGRIAHMVALNTPFAGSRLARYTLQRELREFSPHDQLLRRFAEIVDVNAHITSIFPSIDPVIPDGSALPGAHRNIRVPFVGHFRLLDDPKTLAIVDRIVADPPS